MNHNLKDIKIALVIGSLNMGGAELITLNLSSGLSDLGYDVTVVTVTEPGEWFHLVGERGLKGIHIAGRQEVHPYRHAWRIGKRLRNEKFQIVILVKYHKSERCTQAALNMLSDDVVVIPWVHNDTKETYQTALTNSNAWNAAVGVGVKVANTANEKSKGKPIFHIPNGIELPFNKSNRIKSRSAYDAPFVITYIGRLHHVQKGIFKIPSILKKCYEKNIDFRFNIIGDGPDKDDLLKMFEKSGLKDMVNFHGSVSHKDVYQFLFESHIMLMPSYYEAMPTVLIEAQACGCVPIASKLAGITDTIVCDEETGILIDVNDVDGFANAVNMLAANRDRLALMSHAGMQWAKQYTVEAMSRRFDELIQACLRGEYPLERPRCKWLPVNPLSMHWSEAIPRWIHNLGLGKRFRELIEMK